MQANILKRNTDLLNMKQNLGYTNTILYIVVKNIFNSKLSYLKPYLAASYLECKGKFTDEEIAQTVKRGTSIPKGTCLLIGITELCVCCAVKLFNCFTAGLEYPRGRIKGRCLCLKRNYLDADRTSFVM